MWWIISFVAVVVLWQLLCTSVTLSRGRWMLVFFEKPDGTRTLGYLADDATEFMKLRGCLYTLIITAVAGWYMLEVSWWAVALIAVGAAIGSWVYTTSTEPNDLKDGFLTRG